MIFQDYAVDPNDNLMIAEAKLDNAHNTLVFRTVDSKFFWVP